MFIELYGVSRKANMCFQGICMCLFQGTYPKTNKYKHILSD
ncbi:hypothetical protein M090_1734, partial [Parabacteroides distasonis str. 3776 Po2 i]